MKTINKRIFDIMGVATPTPTVKQRVEALGSELDRRLLHTKRATVAMEAVTGLIERLYAEDATVNVDPATWRILIATPWGSAGWRHWQVRQWEARTLRAILDNRVAWHKQQGSAPLFIYENGSWILNLGDYPTIELAHAYTQKYPLKWREWMHFADKIAKKRHVNP